MCGYWAIWLAGTPSDADNQRSLSGLRRKMKTPTLDTLDKAILAALLVDGRQTQVELAERVPLSRDASGRLSKAG
jgi:hypothetical protein